MNIAAFILALIGFIFSLSPLFFGISFLFFLIALPLGIVGIKKKENRRLGITAIILIIGGFAVIVGHSVLVINEVKGEKKLGEGRSDFIEKSVESDQTQIMGFGGYELGEQLDPNKLSEKDLRNGCVRCPAKKIFQNFEEITLYFTPKTFTVYQISSSAKGNETDYEVIIASFEKKYEMVMEKSRAYSQFSRNGRTISVRYKYFENDISVTDKKLSKLETSERGEIVKSKVDTDGL